MFKKNECLNLLLFFQLEFVHSFLLIQFMYENMIILCICIILSTFCCCELSGGIHWRST